MKKTPRSADPLRGLVGVVGPAGKFPACAGRLQGFDFRLGGPDYGPGWVRLLAVASSSLPPSPRPAAEEPQESRAASSAQV